jgi:Na+/proline symporter
VYHQLWRPEARREALTSMSRRTTFALAAIALLVALAVSITSPDRTIFWYAIFGWSGIGATFCPVIVLALLWPRYNVWGALLSMVTGALCVPLFKFAVPLIPTWGPIISQAEELAPSFLLALVAGTLATLATNPRTGDGVLPS